MDWRIAGSYLESCNCDPICPCRMVNGVAGGRSTYGVCYGVLGWRIEQGGCGDVALAGLSAVLVIRYSDDEPGSPWSIVLHLDEQADERQRELLADILLGRLGGPRILQLPWVRKPSELIDVRVGPIELADGELRVGTSVKLPASRPFETADEVRCVIPGYDVPGEERVAEELVVDDDPFAWELAGNCAYASDFDYASEATSSTGHETPVPPIPQ
ncbi:MAG: hypothetical protein C5B48_05175 [Candidatus Rokuibacteriota bacterium]|nr:MAG: hypothetical protein C5B48_05175 [Candidatus Rokubacteria bacterium]